MESCVMNTIKRQSSHFHGRSRIALRLFSTTQARAQGKTPSTKNKDISTSNRSKKMSKKERATHEITRFIETLKKAKEEANFRKEIGRLNTTAKLRFCGNIIMQTKRTRALAAAAKFSKPDAGHQYRVFFVDGSSITKPNDNSESSVPGDASVTHLGAAVVYKPREGSQNWQVRYFAILNRRGSTLAEQAAIADGLDIATREAMLVRGQNCIGPKGAAAKVIVFTDSVSALQRIQKIQKSAVTEAQLLGDPIIHKLITRSQYLRRIGVQLELRWVPGHSKVEGNALADTEARYAAKNQDIGVLLGEELRLLDSEVIPNDVNEHDPQNNTRRGKS